MKLKKRSITVMFRMPGGEVFREVFYYHKNEKYLELKFMDFIKEFSNGLIPVLFYEGTTHVSGKNVEFVIKPATWFTQSAVDLVEKIRAEAGVKEGLKVVFKDE